MLSFIAYSQQDSIGHLPLSPYFQSLDKGL